MGPGDARSLGISIHSVALVFPKYVSGHEGAPALLPGFAIKWKQNQVTRQVHLCDLSHMLLVPEG